MRLFKGAILIILLLLTSCVFLTVRAYGQVKTIVPDWVFVSTPLKWESTPRRAHLHIHNAPATVLVVYPNGGYASVACLLIEQNDGKVTISRGDGYVVRKGTWKSIDNKLTADATVVFRTLWLVSENEPESLRTEQFKVKQVRGHKELKAVGGQKYAPLWRFADYDGLTMIVNSTARPKPGKEW